MGEEGEGFALGVRRGVLVSREGGAGGEWGGAVFMFPNGALRQIWGLSVALVADPASCIAVPRISQCIYHPSPSRGTFGGSHLRIRAALGGVLGVECGAFGENEHRYGGSRLEVLGEVGGEVGAIVGDVAGKEKELEGFHAVADDGEGGELVARGVERPQRPEPARRHKQFDAKR